MFNNNLLALVVTLVIAFLRLRVNDFAAHKGGISSELSRKIMHIGTGLIFVLCWLLFNNSPVIPFIAAMAPLGITTQFAMAGTGLIKDPSAAGAMSRAGDRLEIRRGPLCYGIILVLLTIIFWRNTPVGVIALMVLYGGDGLADVVGISIKSTSVPWSPRKSLAASFNMLLGRINLAVLIVWVFVGQGYFPGPITHYLLPFGIIAIVTTLVESLPFADMDSLSVPPMSVALSSLLL